MLQSCIRYAMPILRVCITKGTRAWSKDVYRGARVRAREETSTSATMELHVESLGSGVDKGSPGLRGSGEDTLVCDKPFGRDGRLSEASQVWF